MNVLMLAHFLGGYFCTQSFRMCPRWMCQCWRIFWVVISAPKFLECAQGKWASAGAVFRWLFLCPNFQSDPTMSKCTQYECTQNVRVCQMWICPECQSAPNVNVPKMSECAQNVRVHPMWMCPKCLCAQCKCTQNVRGPYQIWKSGHQIWKGGITHGQHEMAHCNALISNTMQQKYKCIGLILEKYTITWNSFVSG